MHSQNDNLTIVKGFGWRKYVTAMPSSKLRPIGTVRVGKRMEGALVLDLKVGDYVLIDRFGAWFELNQESVRIALEALESPDR